MIANRIVTGTSLRTYLITRLALVVPMVFILLTLVFLLMRVAPGNPIQAALGGHVPPAQVKIDRAPARLRQAAVHPVRRLPRGASCAATSARRSPTTARSRRSSTQNGAATLELTFFAMIVAIVVGVVRRPRGRPLPRHAARRLRPFVRDRHLRDARLLPRTDGAARLRRLARLAADLRPGEPDHPGLCSRRTRTSCSSTRSGTATGPRCGT